ncbi:MAG: TOBE domain-containing protein, partial [Gaiellaceae bacterium]
PADLVAAPRDPFVAGFTGANVLRGKASRSAAGLTEIALESGATVYSTDERRGPVSVVIHPWEIALAAEAADESSLNHLRAEVSSLVSLGNRVRVRVGPLTAEVSAASAERLRLAPGSSVVASFKATATRLLPR